MDSSKKKPARKTSVDARVAGRDHRNSDDKNKESGMERKSSSPSLAEATSNSNVVDMIVNFFKPPTPEEQTQSNNTRPTGNGNTDNSSSKLEGAPKSEPNGDTNKKNFRDSNPDENEVRTARKLAQLFNDPHRKSAQDLVMLQRSETAMMSDRPEDKFEPKPKTHLKNETELDDTLDTLDFADATKTPANCCVVS